MTEKKLTLQERNEMLMVARTIYRSMYDGIPDKKSPSYRGFIEGFIMGYRFRDEKGKITVTTETPSVEEHNIRRDS